MNKLLWIGFVVFLVVAGHIEGRPQDKSEPTQFTTTPERRSLPSAKTIRKPSPANSQAPDKADEDNLSFMRGTWVLTPKDVVAPPILMTPFDHCGTVARLSPSVWGFASGIRDDDRRVFTYHSSRETLIAGSRWCEAWYQQEKANRDVAQSILQGK
jgi:hypothetical protein